MSKAKIHLIRPKIHVATFTTGTLQDNRNIAEHVAFNIEN